MNSVIVLILLVFLYGAAGMLNMGSDDRRHAVQVSSAACTLHIARKHFLSGTTTAIVQSGLPSTVHFNSAQSSYFLMLTALMAELNWTVVINQADTFTSERSIAYIVHNYIIMLKTVEDMESIVDIMIRTRTWNPHGNFFIYIDCDLGADWELVLQSFLKKLWREFVINVTFMFPDTQLYVNKFVTWFPYANENHENQMQIIEMGICKENQIHPLNINLFPKKIPSDLNGFPIIVATYLWTPFVIHGDRKLFANMSVFDDENSIVILDLTDGIEIQILRVIADTLNLKPIFRVHLRERLGGVTVHYENRSGLGTGIIGDLIMERADVALCTVRPENLLHELFDHTVQYMQDELTWLVPKSDPEPQWYGLIQLFQGNVWLVSLFLYVAIVFIVYSLNRIKFPSSSESDRSNLQGLNDIALQMWSMMIGIPTKLKLRTSRERFIVFLWALLCLNWYTAYTTSLISRLTTSTHRDKISTIEDVLTNGLKIGMSTPTTNFFRSSDSLDRSILQNFQLCPKTDLCIDRVATQKDYALATSRMHSEDIVYSYRLPNGDSPLRQLEEVIASPPIEMLLIKGHPLLPSINRILLQLVESGLVDYWKHDNKTFIVKDIESGARSLSLFHLMGAFMALFTGLFLAFGVLGIEVLTKNSFQ